jgi:hypothetical protein
MIVDVRAVFRKLVDTKLAKFAVETSPLRLALEIYPAVPRPITVDVIFESKKSTKSDPKASNVLVSRESKKLVETKLARLAVETKLARLAVETRLAKFAVDTTPPIFTEPLPP